MFCNHCGAELPDGSIFCGSCGQRIEEAQPVEQPSAQPEQQYQQQQQYPPRQYQQYQQYQQQPYYQQPADQPKQPKQPGKKHKALPWVITGIVLLLAAAITVVMVFFNPFKKDDGGKTDDTGTAPVTESADSETLPAAPETGEPEPEPEPFPAANVNDPAPQRVADNAGLLSEVEKAELTVRIAAFVSAHDMDMVILTMDDPTVSDLTAYADDFYDKNGYGCGEDSSGLLFFVDKNENQWWITTTGTAVDVFEDEIDSIGEAAAEHLSEGDYAGAFTEFVRLCDKRASEYVSEPEPEPEHERVMIGFKVFNGDGHFTRYMTSTLDDHGRITDKEFVTEGVTTGKQHFEYDEYGNTVRHVMMEGDGTVSETFVYTYDSEGNVLNSTAYAPDGSIYGTTVYTYDASGQLVRETDYNPDGSISVVYESIYDADGNEVETRTTDGSGHISSRYVNTFDADGNELGCTYYEDGEVVETTSFEYNEEGLCKKAIYRGADGAVTSTEHFSYDEYGDVVKHTYFDPNGNLTEKVEYKYAEVNG